MPTRTINLTDHYAQYLEKVLASGRCKNASEVVRTGLRLLERQDAEDAAKSEALRTPVTEGEEAHRRGDAMALRNDGDIDRLFETIADEVDRAR